MELPARLGKYELQVFLGGGMSHVYRARDTIIGRTVAIKILTEQGCQDPEVKSRFLEEARSAGNISHDNIIHIYDFGEDAGLPYMVMEYLQGQDLHAAIKQGSTGDLQNRLGIALQIARALRYIHTQKIVHRDIKPENINLSPEGVVKLMDFGIAKSENMSLTRAGFVLGTPYYMAPEQILGESTDARVDVYAFGVLLFELLTGAKPVTGASVERVFYSILNEPLQLDPLRTNGTPERIIHLIEHCTAKRREDRPSNFDEICAVLVGCLQSQDRQSLPAPERVENANPRRSVFRYLASSLVVLLAVGVVVGVLLKYAPRPTLSVNPTVDPGNPTGEPPTSRVPQIGPNVALYVGLGCLLATGYAVWAYRRNRWVVRGAAEVSRQAPIARPEPVVPKSAAPDEISKRLERAEEATTEPPPVSQTEPAQPPAPASVAEPAEFTRMFQTTPASHGQGTATPPHVPLDTAMPGEFTQMFQVGRGAAPASAPGRSAAAGAVPDVALTVTACADSACIGKSIRPTGFPFRIGRTGVLSFDDAVSREHAEILSHGGGFFLRDLGSSNGTFINGKEVRRGSVEPLLFGSRILLGSNTQLTFVSNELEELPDLTGKVVGERYRLVSKLFASAKSVVYIAVHNELQGPVAVKILSPKLFRHPGYREQFEREAKMAGGLRHSSIARVFDYGETEIGPGFGESLYLVMEYFGG